ncbi:MAG: hypothetical protein FGM61_01305, partial [Sediminibacterium sp.]|nr:hypothetical protein [Sediminibacterium sp.]
CELRVPFLDHRLVEFGGSIPTSRLLSATRTKVIWRDAVYLATKSNEAFGVEPLTVSSLERESLQPSALVTKSVVRYLSDLFTSTRAFCARLFTNTGCALVNLPFSILHLKDNPESLLSAILVVSIKSAAPSAKQISGKINPTSGNGFIF